MLVLQDPETYIHRSGRTGRAGSTGVSVTLVDRKKEGLIPYIQKKAGVVFERIGAPQPTQMAQIAGMPAGHAFKAQVMQPICCIALGPASTASSQLTGSRCPQYAP